MDNDIKKYNRTKAACYLGFITQAITANFLPLLFLSFHTDHGISLERLAMISAVFFITQLIVDLLCVKLADRIGYRRSMIFAEILAGCGLILLSFLPDILPDRYAGILICTILYAVGSGLIEVLCSPIIEACPFENKAGMMSLLHSFYCWGSVGVILISTLFFQLAGIRNWRIMAILWALIPLFNVINFATCPILPIRQEGNAGMTLSQLLRKRIFWLFTILMICAGACELAMAQWASTFVESSLHVSKTVGDLTGPCLFAVFMGISRLLYSKNGEKWDLTGFMILSGFLCLCSYLLAALSGLSVLGLVGCVLCGFSVGIMWPGSISISSKKLEGAGTALFAFLALAGDCGGALGPALVGAVSQRNSDDLRIGILAGTLFPVILILCAVILKAGKKITEKVPDFFRYLFLFILASFIGWLYEIACVWIRFGEYMDRGVLHLPLCPIYGFGMLTLLVIFRKVKNPLLLFLGSTLVTTAIELAASYILEYAFHSSLWTYKGWPLSFQDRISGISSCMFGLMAVLFICLLKPLVDKLFASRVRNHASFTVAAVALFCVIWELRFYL